MTEETQHVYELLENALQLKRHRAERIPTGYCHRVFRISGKGGGESILRLTPPSDKAYHDGCLRHLPELAALGIPVPHILQYGQYGAFYYVLMSCLPGTDLGNVYDSLSEPQKKQIARELAEIQRKVAKLPPGDGFGYGLTGSALHLGWREVLLALIARSEQRIAANRIFDPGICEDARRLLPRFDEYFNRLAPVPFLDDITTKNVMIFNGSLAGIVDIDQLCYGDSLLTVALTCTALLFLEQDTAYADYWLDAMNADAVQRKAFRFYVLIFLLDFMGEQGMCFSNGVEVPAGKAAVSLLTRLAARQREKVNDNNILH